MVKKFCQADTNKWVAACLLTSLAKIPNMTELPMLKKEFGLLNDVQCPGQPKLARDAECPGGK